MTATTPKRKTRQPSALLHHPGYDPNGFLNFCRDTLKLRTDTALAHQFQVTKPQVSKFRSGVTPVTPSFLIRAHELTGMTFAEIRALLGVPPDFML